MSQNENAEWTFDGVLDELASNHKAMDDRSYAFILGAGASLKSGIPTGGQLARRWLEELHGRMDNAKQPFEEWIAGSAHGIDGLTHGNIAENYSKIFVQRFAKDREAGYAALEEAMNEKRPSFGYSLLAHIMHETRHKVVVTTNFDNLVVDALAMLGHKPPLVVAHESLTGFVRPQLRRPLVAKIHRDLFLDPKNDPRGTGEMESGWVAALKKLFQYFTPIVIGYGGNDGSLMGFLKSLKEGEIANGMVWCYRDNQPSVAVQEILKEHNGRQVKIPGFDEFMMALALKLIDKFDVDIIAKRAEVMGQDHAKRCRDQAIDLRRSLDRGSEVEKQLGLDLSKSAASGHGWWSVVMKANEESDPDKRQEIYEQGINRFPTSPELYERYANFLMEIRGNHEAAGKMYEKALELDPSNAITINNYAVFKEQSMRDPDAARKLYEKAFEIGPDDPVRRQNYASLLENEYGEIDRAEEHYKKAIELDPEDGATLESYALFIRQWRNNDDLVEQLLKKAVELQPDNDSTLGHYAVFLGAYRNNPKQALKLLHKAIKIAPKEEVHRGTYVAFAERMEKDDNRAEKLFKDALALSPQNALLLSRYARFLANRKGNIEVAEEYYKKALGIGTEDIENFRTLVILKLMTGNSQSLVEVPTLAKTVLSMSKKIPTQPYGEILLCCAVAKELENESPETMLSRLKGLLAMNFRRMNWYSSELLIKAVTAHLPENRAVFYHKLGTAILEKFNVGQLNDIPEWREINAVDPFAPFED